MKLVAFGLKHCCGRSNNVDVFTPTAIFIGKDFSTTFSWARISTPSSPVHKSNDMTSFRYKYFSENDDFPPFSETTLEKKQ